MVPHHNEYDGFIDSTEALICQLEASRCGFRLIVNDEEESAEYVRSVFNRWREVKEEIEHEDERRFG